MYKHNGKKSEARLNVSEISVTIIIHLEQKKSKMVFLKDL